MSTDLPTATAVKQPATTSTPELGSSQVAALHRFTSELQELDANYREVTATLSQLSDIIQRHLRCDVVGFFQSPETAAAQPQLTVLASSVERVSESVQRWCSNLAGRCILTKRPLLENDPVRASVQVFATPLVGRIQPQLSDCLILVFAAPPDDRHFRSAALDILNVHIQAWNAHRQHRNADGVTRQLAAITELLARVELAENHTQACQLVTEQLRNHLACEHAVIGLCPTPNSACEIEATSGSTGLEQSADPSRLGQAVLLESIGRGMLAQWPAPNDDRQGLLAHRQYARVTQVETIISCPLIDNNGVVRGAWMIAGGQPTLDGESAAKFLRAASPLVASTMQLLRRSEQNRFQRMLMAAVNSVRQRRVQTTIVAVGLASLLLLVPFPYKIKSACELEPTSRRFIAAPFDGKLESSLVQPGDMVRTGQVIARLDGREIEWELAGVQAELHRASKERAGHVAAHESGKARLALHDMDRLQSRKELLEYRGNNLDVRAPVAGVIVSGDLTKSEGIPLQMGHTLFEIAPLDHMVVEVSIPEDDVRFVEAGMPVDIWLDAFPFRKWHATIERINPRSELKDHENVFVAEATIENASQAMRPGMRGSSQIITSRRPLGWNLFHKAAAAMLRWFGW